MTTTRKELDTRALIFTVIAFVISWSIALIGWKAGLFDEPTTFIIGAFAFMWGPAIAALICAFIFDPANILLTLGIKPKFNRWLLWAWFIPVAGTALATAITVFLSDVSLISIETGMAREIKALGLTMADANLPPGGILMLPVFALTLGSLVNAILLISEELGWRGYLWQALIGRGFITTSLVSGIVWGLWHLPLIWMGYNYPGQPVLGSLLMVLVCVLVSFPIGWVRLKNGSVWAASLFHGVFNAVAPISLLFLSNSDMPWRGILGVGGFISFGIIALFIATFNLKAER